jgi:branched-chain amino acid aminotransferase
MIVFLNGKFVPAEKAVVSVFDRSFLYGDGLFEGIPIFNGQPFRWMEHMERFYQGAKMLNITVPHPRNGIKKIGKLLLRKNQTSDGLLRLTLSRGVGVRGYSPKDAGPATFVMTLHALPKFDPVNPPKWKVITSSLRLPAGEPLAQFKTSNKLPQILARAQADAVRADEALLLNTEGFVIEGTTSNLFWIRHGSVCTPPLASGALPGVTRSVVLEICKKLKISFHQTAPTPNELMRAQGIFLSMSSFGIVEVLQLDRKRLTRSPITSGIQKSYWEIVRRECKPR